MQVSHWRALNGYSDRNRVIIQIAHGFAHRQPEPLWEHGLFSGELDPFSRWACPFNIAVLVKSAEHADMLSAALPNFRVDDTLPPEFPRRRRAQPPQGWTEKVILTVAAAKRRGPLRHDVIINTTGGSYGAFRLACRSQLGHRNAVGTVVIDLVDDESPRELADARQRIEQYLQMGYEVVQMPTSLREPSAQAGAPSGRRRSRASRARH